MIGSLVLAMLPPLTVAFLLAGLCVPGAHPWRSHLLLKVCFAIGLALGFSSCTYLGWLLIEGPSRNGLIVGELFFFAIAGGLLFVVWKKQAAVHSYSEPAWNQSGRLLRTTLAVGAGVALVTAVTRFVFLSLAQPHGEVDAVTIWNLRARFLAGSDEQWRESLTNLLASHVPDYPLLLPASIARWWTYLGDAPTMIPALVAMLFTFATVGLVVSSLGLLRSHSQGLLAGVVLLGTPFFIKHGASQYADIPLGFFILATLVAFSLFEREAGRARGLLVIAGLTTGFAAWTKNEGLLFVVVIILVRLFAVVSAKGWKTYGNEMRIFATGLLPVLLVVAFFKVSIAPGLSPIMAQQGAVTTIERMTDLSRYIEAGQAFLKKAVRFGHPGFIVLLGYWLLMGRHVGEADRSGTRTAAGVVALMLTGYFMIFIITPHGLRYQIDTSLDRLWIQLWPSMVFLFFLFVKTPEDVLASSQLASSAITPLRGV